MKSKLAMHINKYREMERKITRKKGPKRQNTNHTDFASSSYCTNKDHQGHISHKVPHQRKQQTIIVQLPKEPIGSKLQQ